VLTEGRVDPAEDDDARVDSDAGMHVGHRVASEAVREKSKADGGACMRGISGGSRMLAL
jgi:cation transport regulator ChaB